MNRQILLIILAGLISFVSIPALAQDEDRDSINHCFPISKSSLTGPRFEVVIPRDNDAAIFKIDKYTGDVWELSNSFGERQRLIKFSRELSIDDDSEKGRINYQLIAVSSTQVYLLNLNTGIMWGRHWEGLFKLNHVFRLLDEDF